jgi:hypothetical protein
VVCVRVCRRGFLHRGHDLPQAAVCAVRDGDSDPAGAHPRGNRPPPTAAGPPSRPGTRKLIDFSLPLAVLLVAVLHFVGDDDQPHAIVSAIRDVLPPGSYLVLSHVVGDIRPEVAAKSCFRGWRRAGTRLRSLFDGSCHHRVLTCSVII